MEQATRHAHTIKGAAGVTGALALRAVAERAEMAAREGRSDDLARDISRLADAYDEFQGVATVWLADEGRSTGGS